MPIPRSPGMRARFNGPPIITSGDNNRINAIHDAFIVGRRTVRIYLSQHTRFHDAIGNAVAIERVRPQTVLLDRSMNRNGPTVSQIRQDP